MRRTNNKRSRAGRRLVGLLAAGISASCGDGSGAVPIETTVEVNVQRTPHSDVTCSGAFARHELDHVTTPRGRTLAMVDGTGSGVFVDDLDRDGLADIVLPNLSGETSVFWNRGGLEFERAVLDVGRFRQAVAVDLDTDGDRDLLLSTGVGPPVAYLSQLADDATRGFERAEFRTLAVGFSMAPGDLGGDGTVEVVTGSYNAELSQTRDLRVLIGNDVGVAVHSIGDAGPGDVTTEYLTDSAQALAALVTDLDGDGYGDVLIGNDLGTPDRLWRWDPRGLTRVEVFDTTSLSTMSLDAADIDNDGDHDLVSTDMAPLPDDPDEAWAELADDIAQARVDDIQQPRNAVQVATPDGFDERAIELGVDASGWSWSGVLGDLDHDGFVDLYVVNGMRAETIFTDLPDGELVEPNQAFRNTGDGFVAEPGWGLDASEGGRGMAQADLDGDGDLDIVVNNLDARAAIWENRLCSGAAITVDLEWSGVQNLDALGATITIGDDGDGDDIKMRYVTGARGYLSTSTTGAHIGLGDDADPVDVVVRWPDGETSVIDDVAPGTALLATRSTPPTPRDQRAEASR